MGGNPASATDVVVFCLGRGPAVVSAYRGGPPAVSGSRVGVSRAAVAGSTLRDLLRVGEALAGADAVRPVVVVPRVDLC